MSSAAYNHIFAQPTRRQYRLPNQCRQSYVFMLLMLMALFGFKIMSIETPEQSAERNAVDAMLTHIEAFRVACPVPQFDRQLWRNFVQEHALSYYTPAGPDCVSPLQELKYSGVINFKVACPTMTFDTADAHRWATYADAHGWASYTQAGAACVDP